MDKIDVKNHPAGGFNFKATISLLHFIENGKHYYFSPSLDITGYGNTEGEAKNSFDVMLDEFFHSTVEKNSFGRVLKELGWKKEDHHFVEPPFFTLIKKNHTAAEIVATKEFHKINLPVAYA